MESQAKYSTEQSILNSFKTVSNDLLSHFCNHLLEIEEIERAEPRTDLDNCVRIISKPESVISYSDLEPAATRSGLVLKDITISSYSDHKVLMLIEVKKTN